MNLIFDLDCYENQAMKGEREELKSELKLISARGRILNFLI